MPTAGQPDPKNDVLEQPSTPPSSQIGGDLIESMPQLRHEAPTAVQVAAKPEAVQQTQAPAPVQKAVGRYANLKDIDGVSFDPKIHQNNHGRPRVSKTTGLLKKWVGPRAERAANSASQMNEPSPLPENLQRMFDDQAARDKAAAEDLEAQKKILTPEQQADASRALAKVTASMLFNLTVGVGGNEWLPQTDASLGLDERANIERALGDYFLATGKTDFPPGWALVIALGAYALPRFLMPQTKSRLGLAGSWFKNKWTGFQLWRKRRAAEKQGD